MSSNGVKRGQKKSSSGHLLKYCSYRCLKDFMSWMPHKFYARLRGKSHSILCQLCANHVVDGRGQDWSEALVKNPPPSTGRYAFWQLPHPRACRSLPVDGFLKTKQQIYIYIYMFETLSCSHILVRPLRRCPFWQTGGWMSGVGGIYYVVCVGCVCRGE